MTFHEALIRIYVDSEIEGVEIPVVGEFDGLGFTFVGSFDFDDGVALF
jgi:hypothetical protein